MRARACALLVLAASIAEAQNPAARTQIPVADESAAAFEGVWASDNDYGPALAGDLVVTRAGGRWQASLGAVRAESASLDFEFPDGGGRFRGVLADGARAMSGWWIQPPGLPGQAFATPVRLRASGPDRWGGAVRPLPQTFTLHLRITRNEDGRWVGAFRNPEFNLGGTRLLAAREGQSLLFTSPDGARVREAAILGGDDRLRLAWPPVPRPVELVRAALCDAPGYLPRCGPAYAYARPPQTGDGWRTGRARDAGFDEAALAGSVRRIIASDPAARRPQLIHSLLVARHGRLVLEEYFHGYGRDTPHDLRSVGKTFASVMLGALMREGAAIGPDTRLYEALARQGPFANPDPRKREIRLAHLMTHTSGLACNDNDEASPGNEGVMQGQTAQGDWWRYALDLPMAHAPGGRYAYCSAGMNLVGAVLAETAGEPVPDLFDRLVARPLQFGRYHWNLMPNGEGYLGGGMYMRPRDLLKVGQLYLDGGTWNGRRILAPEWTRRSTAAHVEINEATTGLDAETFANVALRGADGYAWHRYGVRVGARMVETYEANGNGGQLLLVIPEYDLAVVLTGGNYGQGAIWTRWRDEIVGAQILAALSAGERQ